MKKFIFIVLLSCVGFAVPGTLFAASPCCQLSSGVEEGLRGTASPGEKKLFVQFTYSFTLMDKLRHGGERRSVDDIKNEGKYTTIPTEMEMTKYLLTAAYDFSPKFTGLVTIPYVRNTMDMEMLMGMGMMTQWVTSIMKPVEDLGDITVVGLYRISASGEGARKGVLSLGAGVKTPTGSSTKKNSSGRFIHAHMQPGTGSWDPVLSAIYSKAMKPFSFQADVTYQISTRNPNGYRFGNSLAANLSGEYAVLPFLKGTAGLMFLHLDRASDREGKYTNLSSLMDDPANTGGESVWLSPGIQVLPFKNGAIDLKVQVPVWERVNGTQLVSSYRLLMAVNFRF